MDMAQQAGLSSKQQHLSQCGDSKWGTHPITFGPICLCFSHVYPERFHRWTQVYIRPLGSFSDGISMGEAGIFSDAWLNQQNISNERSQVRFQLYLDLQKINISMSCQQIVCSVIISKVLGCCTARGFNWVPWVLRCVLKRFSPYLLMKNIAFWNCKILERTFTRQCHVT